MKLCVASNIRHREVQALLKRLITFCSCFEYIKYWRKDGYKARNIFYFSPDI